MNLTFNHPEMTDIQTIMRIERAGFSPEEAATEAAMRERIQLISDTFITAHDNEQLVGYIVGPAFHHRYLTDELYEVLTANHPADPYQTVLSLAIDPDYQQLGIASQLLERLAETAKEQGRKGITLTCLTDLIPFYEKNGYQNEGVSASAHADEIWYNMVYEF